MGGRSVVGRRRGARVAIDRLPSGRFRARLMINGQRYTATLPPEADVPERPADCSPAHPDETWSGVGPSATAAPVTTAHGHRS